MLDESKHLECFTEDDILGVLQDELAMAMERYHQQSHPRAILLAGQPGSGKTELSAMIVNMLEKDAAFINADDYRRYHPNYHQLHKEFGSDSVQMTANFSAAVTERLIHELSQLHINLVIEGTGRTVDVPKNTAEALVNKGYTVELSVIAVRPEISLTSTLLRFYQMNEGGTIPRATAIDAHDKVVAALPKNLDALLVLPCISHLTIWDRELSQLFDSETDSILPSEVLLQYWYRPWSSDEILAEQAVIEMLRQKEQDSRLGQGSAINELERRVKTSCQN